MPSQAPVMTKTGRLMQSAWSSCTSMIIRRYKSLIQIGHESLLPNADTLTSIQPKLCHLVVSGCRSPLGWITTETVWVQTTQWLQLTHTQRLLFRKQWSDCPSEVTSFCSWLKPCDSCQATWHYWFTPRHTNEHVVWYRVMHTCTVQVCIL